MKKYSAIVAGAGLIAVLATASPVLADTGGSGRGGVVRGGNKGDHGQLANRGVFGTVVSVSGNTITITSLDRKPIAGTTTPSAGTTYTINATNAKITKDGVTGSISSIVVGDKILVEGTTTGTNVVATAIHDGVMLKGAKPSGDNGSKGPGVSIVKGNGQPIVGGTVTAISGSSITIKNASGVTYTVDATNALIAKNNATSSISSVAVNDKVVVQGAVNGSSVTASSVVVDQTNINSDDKSGKRGLFGGIAKFFGRIFGF